MTLLPDQWQPGMTILSDGTSKRGVLKEREVGAWRLTNGTRYLDLANREYNRRPASYADLGREPREGEREKAVLLISRSARWDGRRQGVEAGAILIHYEDSWWKDDAGRAWCPPLTDLAPLDRPEDSLPMSGTRSDCPSCGAEDVEIMQIFDEEHGGVRCERCQDLSVYEPAPVLCAECGQQEAMGERDPHGIRSDLCADCAGRADEELLNGYAPAWEVPVPVASRQGRDYFGPVIWGGAPFVKEIP